MATSTNTPATKTTPAAKTARTVKPLIDRVQEQLTRAVLGRKVSKLELEQLTKHLEKLNVWLS